MFWAKLSGTDRHDLLAHLIDVGCSCASLLENRLSPPLQTLLMGSNPDRRRRLIPFLVGLHDLGKLTPGFQRKDKTEQIHLKGEGYTFPRTTVPFRHDHGTAALLGQILTCFGMTRKDASLVARLLGGHHGQLPSRSAVHELRNSDHVGQDYRWIDAREQVVKEVAGVFEVDLDLPTEFRLPPATAFLFLGLTTLSDWIGSQEDYFPFAERITDVTEYVEKARDRARNALSGSGWQPVIWPEDAVTPAELIEREPDIENPVLRPVQALAQQVTPRLTSPFLIVLEAATGGGKTEAAWLLADAAARQLDQTNVYIAMPTTATSNQLYKRFRDYLSRRLPGQNTEPLLVHSQAHLHRILQSPESKNIGDGTYNRDDRNGDLTERDAYHWFRSSKRALLARYGVGTVDQTLMGVLPMRHGYLRLFGLAGKVVIFDEVHAYDHYMFTLFERLLTWLRAVGASVIVLSATLPREQTRKMLRAWEESEPSSEFDDEEEATLDGNATADADSGEPRLSCCLDDGTGFTTVSRVRVRQKLVDLDWTTESDSLIARIAAATESGARVAWICNTVGMAQRRYQEITGSHPDMTVDLFHARFTVGDRTRIEEDVTKRLYGKERNPSNDGRLIIATQVIEQSLDLDFDWLITDLPPVDLLIQRIGRLWRHERDDRPVSSPKVSVILPELDEGSGIPRFGSSEYVYNRYILLRTWYSLRDLERLRLPVQARPLIEKVYGDSPFDRLEEPEVADLGIAHEKMLKKLRDEENLARNKRLPLPEEWLDSANQISLYDDDDPATNADVRALTRLGPPSMQVILVRENDSGQIVVPGLSEPLDRSQPLTGKQAFALLQRGVAISKSRSRGALWNALLNDPDYKLPEAWTRRSPLRYQRIVVLDESGGTRIGNMAITYSDTTGLEIDRIPNN